MGIVVVLDDVAANYVLGVGTRLLACCAYAWASVLFIIMMRVAISTLICTSNVLIILDQRTLGYIMIIIKALSNILNLTWLKRTSLILLVCSRAWLLLWGSVEVAWRHSKLFHIDLWVLFIIIQHLMILALGQLFLTLEPHAWFLHWKFRIISSGHLLITIIPIDLLLPRGALTIEWVYLWWLYDSLIFGIDVRQLWLHVLLVTSVTIMTVRVLEGPLLALYEDLLVILVLVEILLII